MTKRATQAEKAHMDRVAELGCILCKHLNAPQLSKTDLHHLREGQGMAQRASNWLVVPLCHDSCHQGPLGIHGNKTLLRIAKADEMDLLAWTLEALA
jgi:hypothetical protein